MYRNIRAGFDDNLTRLPERHSIPHAFHHNAFLVVSNGDRARYGSITSKWEHFAEWKRNDEKDKGRLDAEVLLDGMLAKERLLDLVENFILFDDSRPGGTRKIVARNHQVLGVNNAVASVLRQEELKKQFPPEERLRYRVRRAARAAEGRRKRPSEPGREDRRREPGGRNRARRSSCRLIERAHPDLGRLGVFWHTQGSGKSYSMAFFAEKVRRVVPGNFTFVVMTDREDLDDQICRTFVGCGVADEKTPRAGSGEELQELLQAEPPLRLQPDPQVQPGRGPATSPTARATTSSSISDEAHRTQAGKFARNMRLALPNASFIGFTGTPLFKHDHLTRRIFGELRLPLRLQAVGGGRVHGQAGLREPRRKAGHRPARPERPHRRRRSRRPNSTRTRRRCWRSCWARITRSSPPTTGWTRSRTISSSTARRAGSAASRCWCASTRSPAPGCTSGSSRAGRRSLPQVRGDDPRRRRPSWPAASDADDAGDAWPSSSTSCAAQAQWMESTIIEIIISEAQNEVRDFRQMGLRHHPPPRRDEERLRDAGRQARGRGDAFKDPEHPFRVAIVCAMWLTGFDVECLSTLYIDKPMKAHTLMQAIARANRVYPGKDVRRDRGLQRDAQEPAAGAGAVCPRWDDEGRGRRRGRWSSRRSRSWCWRWSRRSRRRRITCEAWASTRRG